MSSPSTSRDILPIDALAPTVDGRYEDPYISVTAAHERPPRHRHTVRTDHFDLTAAGGRVHLTHTVPPSAVDDDLAGILQDELFGPGWLRGGDLFERVLTGVVRTSAADALDSWELFYRNTMARIDAPRGAPSDRSGHGCIDDYAPVYQHACELLVGGSVLELGCCFGFLSLRIARTGRSTIASDVSRGTVALLDAIAPRLGVQLTTITADAARFPAEDRLADTVLAIHLLEHLEPTHGTQVIAEALRLARRRVVVAVPLEDEADETFGHVRTVSLEDLREWGGAAGHPFDVHEFHGGWLVIDVR
jgi:SAM-dependent methyltransferase